jgi:hypothetical protein
MPGASSRARGCPPTRRARRIEAAEEAFDLRYGSPMIFVWANVWANDGILASPAISRQNDEDPAFAGPSCDGRGGFRTCDLSRVKRALSH